MSPGFFQTIIGRRFLEGTLPEAVKQINRLNKNLEKLISIFEDNDIEGLIERINGEGSENE